MLYYGDVGFFNGIVALCRFDPAAGDLIEHLPDDAAVTIALARGSGCSRARASDQPSRFSGVGC